MEPRSLAYQSGTLTITPNCFLCLCEVIIEPYSCLGDSVQFIEFNENLFILEKLEYMVADICCMTKCWLYFNSFSLLAGQHCVTISSFPSSNIDGSSKNSPGLSMKVMFSVLSVCSQGGGGGSPYVTTHGPIQTIPSRLCPIHFFNLVHYVPHTSIGKRAVGLRLKAILVYDYVCYTLFGIFFTELD